MIYISNVARNDIIVHYVFFFAIFPKMLMLNTVPHA